MGTAVISPNESEARRPDFVPGPRFVLADGRAWTPRPIAVAYRFRTGPRGPVLAAVPSFDPEGPPHPLDATLGRALFRVLRHRGGTGTAHLAQAGFFRAEFAPAAAVGLLANYRLTAVQALRLTRGLARRGASPWPTAEAYALTEVVAGALCKLAAVCVPEVSSSN